MAGSVEEAVEGADTVVLCVPVGAMEEVLRQALPKLSPSALVTDVGSVKKSVCDALAPLVADRALFVGSHPMAGSEKAGLSAARADLFVNAVCILTPEPGHTKPAAIERAEAFWTRLGCRVRSLSPQTHDEVCALISHLPHLTAAALVHNVAAEQELAGEREQAEEKDLAMRKWEQRSPQNRNWPADPDLEPRRAQPEDPPHRSHLASTGWTAGGTRRAWPGYTNRPAGHSHPE